LSRKPWGGEVGPMLEGGKRYEVGEEWGHVTELEGGGVGSSGERLWWGSRGRGAVEPAVGGLFVTLYDRSRRAD